MSNTLIPNLISKFRSINQLVKLNIRQAGSLSSNLNVHQLENVDDALHQSVLLKKTSSNVCSPFGHQKYRLIHICRSQCSSSTTDTPDKKKSLDQFRAEEVSSERAYEEKQKHHEEQTNHKKNTEESENQAKVQEVRARILDASLQFVTTHGWSVESIAHGAESINYPGVAHGMFPNGAIELVQHFYKKCNTTLIEQLQQELHSSTSDSDSSAKPVETPNPKEFAIKAIRMRLEMIVPYIDTWPQAMGIMTLPQNVPVSLAQLLTLVDDICYCAGDRSIDIGWYTRRVGIASIYKMVELFMLQDKSPGYKNTWEFLERRMDEAIQIQEFLITSEQTTKTMGKALGSAFHTARNILGINCDKRR